MVISPIAVPVQVPGLIFVSGFGLVQWRKLRQSRVLQHHGSDDDTDNLWTLTTTDARSHRQSSINVTLKCEGYRSANLLILVFQPDNNTTPLRIPVWFDAVSARQFSYLNAQLMFNTHSKR